jgi:hypothetical protein
MALVERFMVLDCLLVQDRLFAYKVVVFSSTSAPCLGNAMQLHFHYTPNCKLYYSALAMALDDIDIPLSIPFHEAMQTSPLFFCRSISCIS